MVTVVELAYGGAIKFSTPSFGDYNQWRCYAYLPKQDDESESVEDDQTATK